ncbi:MAG: PadR family transcriptional regulator [Gemmatimonadaceae bacterium]|nr:PadR family transcriptional regulator [Gemmatimonadaceae bacterium]MDQ3243767.1 PadR family transcriptional regulator [Gemmatimonadota bacterium]
MRGGHCGSGSAFGWAFAARPENFGFDPGAFWGGRGRSRGGPFGGGRMFDQGHLKFVILQLLAEKPRHGYEIIKEIEEKFSGMYSPSPGTVYPTLTMLEDLGYARANPEEGGKKIYEITDEGRAHLAENQPLIDDIFSRIAEVAQNIFGEPMMEVHRGMKNVGRAVYGSRNSQRSAEQIRKIKEILERAAADIDAI